MTDHDGYQDGGEREPVFNRLDHGDIERLVAGDIPADQPLADLAATIAGLRESSAVVPPHLAAAHVAAAAGAARDAGLILAAAPGRHRGAWFLSGTTAKALVGVAVGLALILGAGAAGLLPNPIQSAVANAAEVVGIRLPRPGSTPPVVVEGTTTIAFTTTSATTVPPEATTTTPPPSTTTTVGEEDDDDDDRESTGGPLAGLVGTHSWTGSDCGGTSLQIRYELTSSGELELISVSGPETERDLSPDQIDVEFGEDIRVQIDLERSGDDWRIEESVDRNCDDDGDDDGEESDDD